MTEDRRETTRIMNQSHVFHREYAWPSPESDYRQDTLVDCSADGFAFETATSYAKGDFLQVRLQIFGWMKFRSGFQTGIRKHTDPFIAIAKVVEVVPGSGHGNRIGCSFESVDDSDKKALAAYLDHLKQKSS